MRSAGFKGNQGSKAMGIGFMMEQAPTLLAGQENHVCIDLSEMSGGGTEHVSDDSDESDNVHAICFQQNQREEVRILGEQAGALTAESGMHNTNFLVLNDQGGSVMDVSDRAGCLRAQEHGHQPVVCFEKENYNE